MTNFTAGNVNLNAGNYKITNNETVLHKSLSELLNNTKSQPTNVTLAQNNLREMRSLGLNYQQPAPARNVQAATVQNLANLQNVMNLGSVSNVGNVTSFNNIQNLNNPINLRILQNIGTRSGDTAPFLRAESPKILIFYLGIFQNFEKIVGSILT